MGWSKLADGTWQYESQGRTWRGIPATCEQCGAEFAYRRGNKGRYCSLQCANRAPKPARNVRGPDHYNWRGGRYVEPDGYVWVWVESGGYSNRRKLEHRLVMEQALGRELLPTEQVHHINGDKGDNRLENLQLRTGPHGPGAAYCCADCGSRNLRPIELL